jgi:hypothetical protein
MIVYEIICKITGWSNVTYRSRVPANSAYSPLMKKVTYVNLKFARSAVKIQVTEKDERLSPSWWRGASSPAVWTW